MRHQKLSLFGIALLASFVMGACNASPTDENKQSYDGRVYDISFNQDQSLTAKSIKVGNEYELTISGSGDAIDFSKKEEVPWNPIVKKINKVTIENGIKNIGDYYFFSLPLESFVLPESVNYAANNSFNAESIIYTYGGQLNNLVNEVYYYSETKPVTDGKYFHLNEDGDIQVWVLKTLNFLFIGNSFTYRGANTSDTANPEVPLDFKKIASNLGIDVNIDSVCQGSHTLTKFANPDDEKGAIVESKLTTNKYDYVILQEQSTAPINNYNTFLTAVKKLKKRIDQTQTDCKTILYETWGTPYNTSNDPQTYGTTVGAMEAKIREAYKNAGEEANCPVNYIGKAFTYSYEHNPSINIYADDNRHQNAYGAYLSAACHVRSLFKVAVKNCSEYCGLSQNECKALLSVTDTVI